MAGYGPRISNSAPLNWGNYPMSGAYNQSGYSMAGGGGGEGFLGNLGSALTGNPIGAIGLGLSGIGAIADYFDWNGERAEQKRQFEEQLKLQNKQLEEGTRASKQQETFQGYDRLAKERADINKNAYLRQVWRAMR